jgi:hypothetical protein
VATLDQSLSILAGVVIVAVLGERLRRFRLERETPAERRRGRGRPHDAGCGRGSERSPPAQPAKRGGRFSTNAAIPSAWSGCAPASPWSVASSSSDSSNVDDAPASERALRPGQRAGRLGRQPRGDRVGLREQVRGRDDAAHEPDPRRLLGRQRLVQQRDLGGLRRADEPLERPRRAAVGDEPMPANASTNRAVSAAIRRSQANAIDAPAPAATPLTAAITGWGVDRIARTSGL